MMKQKYSAFIVDDDPIFVMLFKKIIAKSSLFDIIENFKDGQLAIEALETRFEKNINFPDIIFLDLNMPNVDGWQFLEISKNKSFSDKLKIFIVSSSIDTAEIEKSKIYKSVKDFITKPINLEFFETYKEKFNY